MKFEMRDFSADCGRISLQANGNLHVEKGNWRQNEDDFPRLLFHDGQWWQFKEIDVEEGTYAIYTRIHTLGVFS